MPNAVIVDVVRTPGGRRNGVLSGWHPADLAAEALKALQERNGLDPAIVDDVIVGCVMQVGAQALNVGRNAVLAAGWPDTVPVSYTHLDVYKRQLTASCWARSSRLENSTPFFLAQIGATSGSSTNSADTNLR